MAQGTTRVTMLAHQPGVDTSSAVETEDCSSKESKPAGTAARAVRGTMRLPRSPETKAGAARAKQARRAKERSLEAISLWKRGLCVQPSFLLSFRGLGPEAAWNNGSKWKLWVMRVMRAPFNKHTDNNAGAWQDWASGSLLRLLSRDIVWEAQLDLKLSR